MTNHNECSHPATKSERAKCRRLRNSEKPQPYQTNARDRQLAEMDELRKRHFVADLNKTAAQRARKSAQSATRRELAEYAELIKHIESRETDTLSDVQADIEKLRDVTSKMF